MGKHSDMEDYLLYLAFILGLTAVKRFRPNGLVLMCLWEAAAGTGYCVGENISGHSIPLEKKGITLN